MQLIRPEPEYPHPFHRDVLFLVDQARVAGYEVAYHDVVWAWEQYSNMFAASWLVVERDMPPETVIHCLTHALHVR
jgi:hypothetical protein